jgi:GT2 family glycosyltransferase
MADSPSPKDMALALARAALRSFLDTGCVLDLAAAAPQVSVLLLLCNRAELTLACLQSLALRMSRTPLEVIAVDNGSTDETAQLLQQFRGLKVLRNETNAGFPRAVNQAARQASGKHLLLLNNDAQVLGRSIEVAVQFLEDNPDVGAVGGKIVLLDGTLQEAGCIILQSGWTHQYGRSWPADDPASNFQRDVDYCSGAFLMTPRALFERLGGLDEAFSPGYFEDPDYSLRLRQAGYRFVYLPDVAILHYENATSSGLVNLRQLTARNHRLFVAKNARWLRSQPRQACPHTLARTSDLRRFRILLVIDGLIRDLPAGQALAALQEVIGRMQALDGFVTLCLTGAGARRARPLLRRLPRTAEVVCLEQAAAAEEFLAERAADYELVVADNPARLRPLAAAPPATSCAVLHEGRLTLAGAPGAAESPGPLRRAA